MVCLSYIAVASLVASSVTAFAPVPLHTRAPLRTTNPLNVIPESFASSELLSMNGDFGDAFKAGFIALVFGGGLIPATFAGNKAMFETLAGKRRGGESDDQDSKTSMDPTIKETKYRAYIESSGATGPTLAGQPLLFPNEDIKLVDIIAIMGRISDVNSIADWKNLPSTKLENVSVTKPPMWLPRGAFKVNVRKAKFIKWPVDPKTGLPVGGEELKKAEEKRISQQGALIGDAALDAVWDTWAWGASIATPDKVIVALRKYHPNSDVFSVGDFTSAAIGGRSITGIAALTFIAIQVIAFGTLFIAPALRTFLDVDIGFGELGMCDPATCKGFGDLLS
jgi:hypothetical protein